jgi:hypothetical protein
MDDDALDRIFTGQLGDLPKPSSKVVRIFTSSTFTDMLLERNTLMEFVYPRIKEYCRDRYGVEFQVVDMRWGVRDEMTNEHMTSELCMRELAACQHLSIGAASSPPRLPSPNFHQVQTSSTSADRSTATDRSLPPLSQRSSSSSGRPWRPWATT